MSQSSQMFSLEGQLAVITGGGTGIGQAIAQCMHECGATVALVGRRETELAKAVESLGSRAHYFIHDIVKTDEAGHLVRRIENELGPISCLVNNAGMHLKKPAVETSAEEFQAVLNTNVVGAHALTNAVVPGMIQRRTGSILFIASMASLFGIPQVIAYSAAKTAHLGMVRTLSTEISEHGVRVNAIAPGWIETEMSRKALANDADRLKKILSRTPMNRLGKPSDVGWAAVYLASPASSFITGSVIPVDGGASIGF